MRKLFCTLAFTIGVLFSVNAEKLSNSTTGWQGDISGIKAENTILENSLIDNAAECWHFNALHKKISIYHPIERNKKVRSLWGSFLALKKAGEEDFGLSVCNGENERLFINVSRQVPTLYVFRIDFSTDGDKAYIFQNPSTASVPDVENAEYTVSGQLDFNRFYLRAGKGTEGYVSDIQFGEEFSQVVSPKEIKNEVIKGESQKITGWQKSEQALWLKTSGGTLYIQPHKTGSIHIMYGSEKDIRSAESYAVIKSPETAKFKVEESEQKVLMQTADYSVSIDKEKGFISLMDSSGKMLIEEWPGEARTGCLNGKAKPYCKFKPDAEEALYGLGQFRDSHLNLRNISRELVQFNTQAAVPVLYSTKGWGIFWDNPARTVYTDNENGMSLYSDYGSIVNYYLFVGNSLDRLVTSYRSLTGTAPMLPEWALGYHQSRNKYSTQKEVMDIAQKMQEHHLQMSSIFVDYYYWQKYGTGSHRFDEDLFPDVRRMLDSLHHIYDTRLVITMWPTFNKNTDHYKEMDKAGFLLNGARALDGTIYDPFNPDARKLYWQQVTPLVEQGIDGWFLDGPEPDIAATFLPQTTFAGPAVKVRNLYPLVHCTGFYQGLLKARPGIRPYMLTRCAWAAQQRIGTAIWSGDIPPTFMELKKQIVAGLNFTATGIPYWTTDIGGYSGGNPADEAYQEIFARWFEYGTFCPIFRAHGRRYPGNRKTSNEPWAYGTEVENICRDFINLRYRLFPYIYSLSGMVTRDGYTPMRLLAFDFPEDRKVLDCKDEFMYGPALLVCPVAEEKVRERKVYLPEGSEWYNFWSEERYKGGEELTAAAPLERIPVFVRAGSILPMYRNSSKGLSPEEPVDLKIFTGRDGSFDWYEDDGETLDYQKGRYNLIRFHWDDRKGELSVTGLHKKYKTEQKRIIYITFIDGKKASEKKIIYTGKDLSVTYNK